MKKSKPLVQVGFTTDPVDDRSTMYTSDVGALHEELEVVAPHPRHTFPLTGFFQQVFFRQWWGCACVRVLFSARVRQDIQPAHLARSCISKCAGRGGGGRFAGGLSVIQDKHTFCRSWGLWAEHHINSTVGWGSKPGSV